MKTTSFFWVLVCVLLSVSCSDNEERAYLTFSGRTSVTLEGDEDARATLSFSSDHAWQAVSNADWVSVTPASGNAGTNEVVVEAQSENRSGESRTATLTFTSGSIAQQIEVIQQAGRYVQPRTDTVRIGSEGGEVNIHYTTNMEDDEYAIYRLAESGDWLTQSSLFSRSESAYYVPLYAYPNQQEESRTAYIVFAAAGEDLDSEPFAKVTVIQSGQQEDELDKVVRVLHQATQGAGIPVVLMGDGFTRSEIEEGYYDRVMDKAFDNLFSEEPVRSLIDYFDVYAINAVSYSDKIGSGNTAFDCWLEGGNSTLIEGDDRKVVSYVESIEGINVENALAVVIADTEEYAGTTYFAFTGISGNITEFAIAYCPIIDGLESELFRNVLLHEAIGHGIAKLGDEYSYASNGTIPDDEIEDVRAMQAFGWTMNIDFTENRSEVLWAEFLSDSRYADEKIGIYEGAYTYARGAYRPTDESIMNSNFLGFNAPSRQALYNKIISLGENRNPTYDEFTSFDLQTSRTRTRAATSVGAFSRPFHHPIWVKRRLPNH